MRVAWRSGEYERRVEHRRKQREQTPKGERRPTTAQPLRSNPTQMTSSALTAWPSSWSLPQPPAGVTWLQRDLQQRQLQAVPPIRDGDGAKPQVLYNVHTSPRGPCGAMQLYSAIHASHDTAPQRCTAYNLCNTPHLAPHLAPHRTPHLTPGLLDLRAAAGRGRGARPAGSPRHHTHSSACRAAASRLVPRGAAPPVQPHRVRRARRLRMPHRARTPNKRTSRATTAHMPQRSGASRQVLFCCSHA